MVEKRDIIPGNKLQSAVGCCRDMTVRFPECYFDPRLLFPVSFQNLMDKRVFRAVVCNAQFPGRIGLPDHRINGFLQPFRLWIVNRHNNRNEWFHRKSCYGFPHLLPVRFRNRIELLNPVGISCTRIDGFRQSFFLLAV